MGREQMQRGQQILLIQSEGLADETHVVINQRRWRRARPRLPVKARGQRFAKQDSCTS